MSRRPLLLSHRTQMGTMPENTLAGIEAAVASGVDGVEIDVRGTADGIPVLLHDETLERTTGDPRRLATVEASALRDLRVRAPSGEASDEPLPTLTDAIATVSGRCLLVIEVKEPGLEQAIAGLVRDAGAARWCWLWSFDPDVAGNCRAALPEVPAALLAGPVLSDRYGPGGPIEAAVRGGFAGVSLHHSLVTAEQVDAAHRRGLAVYTWTVDDASAAERLREADVDALASNVPERVRDALRGAGS